VGSEPQGLPLPGKLDRAELRDDKSPLFTTLESTILQQEIKNDNVEGAFADYLQGLDEIARLDVRGVWFEERRTHRMVRHTPSALRIPEAPRSEWDHGTYHVSRAPSTRRTSGHTGGSRAAQLTAWEKSTPTSRAASRPVVFERRMHLFWTTFREVTKPVPKLDRKGEGPPPSVGKDWEIQVAYSVYDRGRWSRKRMSAGGVIDSQTFVTTRPGESGIQIDGSRVLSPADYTLRATVSEGQLPRLHVHLYCRSVDRVRREELVLEPAEVQRVATFELNGCNGALVPDRPRAVGRALLIPRVTKQRHNIFHTSVHAAMGNIRAPGASHPFRIGDGGFVNGPSGYSVDGMGFAVSRGTRGALLAFPPGDASGTAVALPAPRDAHRGATIVPVTNPNQPEQRGLYPFFFQDRFQLLRPSDLRRLAAAEAGWRSLRTGRPVSPAAARPGQRSRPAPRRGGRGRQKRSRTCRC
jgi:hypothetical protein